MKKFKWWLLNFKDPDGGDAGGGGDGGGDAGDGGTGAGDSGDGGSVDTSLNTGDAGAGDSGGSAGDAGSAGDTGEPTNHFKTMPDDWRPQVLTNMGIEPGEEFDKRLKQMERYSDFNAFSKSGFDAQDRIRKGEISTGIPENATDEQMATYREANGIPVTADAYELSLDEGLVLGEADNRIMEGVFKEAHSGNIPAETMSAMTNAMLKGRQQEEDARMSQDGVDRQTTDRQLKDTWGGDFETNINMVKGLVNTLPDTVRDVFSSARMADGKAIFNSPEVMVAMAEWARKLNPAATVVPNANNPMLAMDDEITALEGRMGEEGWHKDAKAQKRYQDLITARDGMKAQA